MALVHIIDDDPVMAAGIAAALAREGHELATFARPEDALEAVRSTPPAVAITDFAMPGMNGLELLLAVREVSPDTTFVVVSGQAKVEDAVTLMKHGVVDVLVKPPRTPALRKALALALSQHELAAENRRLRDALRGRRDLSQVIGASSAFEGVLRRVEKVAPSSAAVLLTGETGTGKEVFAEAIHQLSPRAERRLVKVHCAAIPAGLLESELFGHMRGSFTGAVKDKAGYFEAADGGSIFLDEIGEVPLDVQVKLLRVLQTGDVQRIGETKTRHVDARVIAATNRDLEVEVAEGRFREDLFYRINVIPIEIPPLRRRAEDIVPLALHFLKRARLASGSDAITGFAPAALTRLAAHRWPGNVRELENVVTRAVALAEGPLIEPHDLPDSVSGTPGEDHGSTIELPATVTLEEAEELLIRRALDATGGNKREAARRLGISLATLYRKIGPGTGG